MTLAVAHARGSPRALGRAQGEAFAPLIHEALAFYRQLAAAQGRDLDALGAATLPYIEAGRRSLPHIAEELEGLVEGAGASREDLYTLNCQEEVWPYPACSTIVHGRYLLHAEQWLSGHAQVGVLVAVPDDGPAFVSPTSAGCLAAVGLSSAGFAQGIDSLEALDERVGVPRTFVARLALGAASLRAAVDSACSEGRAGGYAHVLASPRRTVIAETTATEHAVVEDVVAHTNHYLARRLAGLGKPPSAGSRSRLERVRELVAQQPPSSLEDCARILADHDASPQSLCVHEDGIEAEATVFGMVCDLAAGAMLVSDGRPCEGRWEEFGASPTATGARRVG